MLFDILKFMFFISPAVFTGNMVFKQLQETCKIDQEQASTYSEVVETSSVQKTKKVNYYSINDYENLSVVYSV